MLGREHAGIGTTTGDQLLSIGLRCALSVLSQRCDVDFACYEPATLHRRIRSRIARVADSDAAYAELLYANPDA